MTAEDYTQLIPSQEQQSAVEVISRDTVLLRYMEPFILPVNTLGFKFHRQAGSNDSKPFRKLNDGYQTGTPKLELDNETLVMWGKKLPIDKKLIQYGGSAKAQLLIEMELANIGQQITEYIIKGDRAADPDGPEGLYTKLIASNQHFCDSEVEIVTTANTALLSNREKSPGRALNDAPAGYVVNDATTRKVLLEWIDKMIAALATKPTVMIMPSGVRSMLKQAMQESPSIVMDKSQFGENILFYDGIPIEEMDRKIKGDSIIGFDERRPDGTANFDCASILFFCFGVEQFYGGIRGQDFNLSDAKELDDGSGLQYILDYDFNHVFWKLNAAGRLTGIRR